MTTFSDYWFSIEAQVGLIAACLPTVPGLFKGTKMASSFRSWWISKTDSSSGSKSDGVARINSNDSVVFLSQDVLEKK